MGVRPWCEGKINYYATNSQKGKKTGFDRNFR